MDVNYKPIVVDTCAIMNDSSILENLINLGYSIIISIVTVEELDNLKTNCDYCRSKQARHAIRAIENLRDKIKFDIERIVDSSLISECPSTYNLNDDIIVTCAKRNNSVLATNDLNLKVKAKIIGIEAVDYNIPQNNYLGYKVVNANDNEIASVYEKPNENIFQNLTNEYVIINDTNENFCDILKWNGCNYVPVVSKNIKTVFFGDKFKPKDEYQRMAIDSLLTNQITCITGKAGSGKSLLSLIVAMNLIEAGKYNRLVVLFNPCPVRGASQLGYYSGDVVEKAMQSNIGNVLITKFGDRFLVDNYINSGKIKLVPMVDCRGMEINDDEILWITEAENTTTDLMKICLSRVSSGAKVFVEGDFKQTDSSSYEENNGLKRVIEIFKDNSIFGYVDLQNIWRSKIAELADKL